ncbi:1,4-dihydroxy-2-naphthoate octaprenyltransferase [Kistimonas scapharcae]|uniref:1,4-dihydroxy-2-naphthoate octaprenyltransferase n=1 Tax=Kistimonas scapharcae TaxID=1036133 RepID=A0ABP8UWK8_9GAMM
MQQAVEFPQKYRFIRALRPFSFSVALMSCGLGVTLAYQSGEGHLLRSVFVMIAGVLLQAATNLFNDYADLNFWRRQTTALATCVMHQIRMNAQCAMAMAFVACLLGLYLVSHAGWQLLLIGLLGVAGGYFYTAEPVNLKERGLGLVAVFVFTGLLMVEGAYMAVSGDWSFRALLLALPLSILSSLVLLANELRDVEDDSQRHIKTFTVRFGFTVGRSLYLTLFLMLFAVVVWLTVSDFIHEPMWLLPSVVCLYWPLRLLFSGQKDLSRLPPMTGRVFMVFGLGLMCAV